MPPRKTPSAPAQAKKPSVIDALTYNATIAKGRRQAPKAATAHEDFELKIKDRLKLQATAREQVRNFSLAAWAVRRHLDYVSRFELHVRTGIDELDILLGKLFDRHALAENFDVAGRFDRDQVLRLFESSKVIDGDCALLLLQDGRVQAIESDRICKPASGLDAKVAEKISELGLELDPFGKVINYCITGRGKDGKGKEFQMLAPAASVIFDGYFTRFDQTRGISPLSTALNALQDCYEAWEWTLIKIKLHALLGIAFSRENPGNIGPGFVDGTPPAEGAEASSETTYDVKIGESGLMQLDMAPGDKVDTIESKTPNVAMIDYTGLMVRVALLALDIPYTAFDSMKSSYSARIADRNEYEESAAGKRKKNQAVLRKYARWCIERWIADSATGLKPLIPADKFPTVDDLLECVEWVPTGTPWLDKLNEVQGDMKAVSLGVDSLQRICRRRGLDFFKIAQERAEEVKELNRLGVPFTIGDPGQAMPSADQTTPAPEGDQTTDV